MADIVLVEDEEVLRRTLAKTLQKLGHEVRDCESAEAGLETIEQGPPDLLITDHRLPGMSGYELLGRVTEGFPEIAVVLMTAYGTIEDAVKAMRDGAADYLRKPIDLHELAIVVDRCLNGVGIRKELQYYRSRDIPGDEVDGIVGNSPAMQSIRALVTRLASIEKKGGSGPTILLAGETGTGKGLVARAVHKASPRADKPFIEVNCTAIPENLLEAEMMGYEKGAFTDANSSKTGLVEAAEGGTIFFDEIGHMSKNLQSKLLKVIDEKVVRRLGSTRDRKVNCTIVTASHMNLETEVAEGRFFEDLYHRINVVNITLPPLRERNDDILTLANYFLEKHANEYGMEVPAITESACRSLLQYSWPGNIRELSHTIERALIMHSGPTLSAEDLAFFPAGAGASAASVASQDFDVDFSKGAIPLEAVEANLIRRALDFTGGNQVKAAKLLGLSRDTLRYRLDKYDLR
ncbi:MAG: sigma-54-dependent transcriptional regulator [Candidatus Binatia bacterium]